MCILTILLFFQSDIIDNVRNRKHTKKGKVKVMKFEIGKEYKTVRKNGEIGVRTFTVKKYQEKTMQ